MPCITGKVRYRDKLGAMLGIASVDRKAGKGDARRDETRIYRCPHCNGYHLTSQTKRRSA
jgi:hypothetical protein